jgi:hypothetical protein
MTTMHHITVDADRETGAWDDSSIAYAGEVDRAEFFTQKDTDDRHFDAHHMDPVIRRVVEMRLDVDSQDKSDYELPDVAVTVTHVD